MRVSAELDREGRLHVLEQQSIVFNGAWNGGERRFNLRPGQRLIMHNIYRIDPTGNRRISLQQGNLARVDHWVWHNATTLRWRARLPSDPPFSHKVITYILDYTLSGILLPVQNGYQLNHDFAFPNRDGVIQQFSLQLTLDPSWQVRGKLPSRIRQYNLPPGKSVLLSAVLLHPDGVPAAVGIRPVRQKHNTPAMMIGGPVAGSSIWLRVLIITLIGLLTLLQGINFLAHERRLGRFKKLLATNRIDGAWLEKHVFSLSPEVVGATWDKMTNTSEVAAVLARMVLEEKMKSRVEQEVFPWLGFKIPGMYTLHLSLLVPRSTLRGYERELVDGLFIDGDTTDTKKVKKYYRSNRETFDPVNKIREPLKKQVRALTQSSKNSLEMIWAPTAISFAIGFFILLADFFIHQYEHPQELLLIGGLVTLWGLGLVSALNYRATAIHVQGRAQLLWAWTLFIFLGYTAALLFVNCSALLVLGSACLCAAAINNILNSGRSRDSIEGVKLRRYLASAHGFFKGELKKQDPDIRDSWFPYLVAFGLGPTIDSWFRRYGGHLSTAGSSFSGTGSHTGFTGGGGQFGGGGAGGVWSAAAGSMGASASSSSGGGGFGGGGSGGGGGGGF
jgi:uncharacterized membrane protein YgcG